MASRNPQPEWILPTPPRLTEPGPRVQVLLEEMSESCSQVQLAAEFLLLELDQGPPSPQVQLACLIKERAEKILEQMQALSRALSCPGTACDSPSQ